MLTTSSIVAPGDQIPANPCEAGSAADSLQPVATIPDWLMLVVTLIAAGVVAWLAYETRRSAKASQDAATAANGALLLARAEELHSRQLVAEAIKTRIDSLTPAITIVPHDQLRVVNDVELPVHFPQSDDKNLFIAAGFSVFNDSATTVVLRRRTVPFYEGASPENDSTVVAPGQRTFVAVEVSRPLSEWRAVADWAARGDESAFREAHRFERDARIIFSFLSAADDGVSDEYTFRLVGSPLTPLAGQEGAYNCFGANQVISSDLQVVADPRRRTYYLSRSKGQELPSPAALGS